MLNEGSIVINKLHPNNANKDIIIIINLMLQYFC